MIGYLPSDPPGYEAAVFLLTKFGHIRLYSIGMPLMVLNETLMRWEELK